MIPKALSVSEAAQRSRLATCSIYQLIKENKVEHFRIGRKHYVTEDSLISYMKGSENMKSRTNIQVTDINQIIDRMNDNAAEALDMLSLLNKSVNDQESYYKARNAVDDLYHKGIISRRLQDHMHEELSCVYQPESYEKPEKGMHDFGTFKGIKAYIKDNDYWVIKEILLWNAFCLENNTPLSTCTFNADAHYSVGDIPENIVPLAKAWYTSICSGKSKDFHSFAKGYGYEA